MTYRYPKSWVVVLGLCPPPGWGETPTFGDAPSVSATRMDTTLPEWREQALGANLWWTHDDWDLGRPHHLQQILRDTRCRVVVALGRDVQRELGLKGAPPFFEWQDVGELRVMPFPHPSGLCRVWNEYESREAATAALQEAMRRHPSCTG